MRYQQLDVIPAASFSYIDVALTSPLPPLCEWVQCLWATNRSNPHLLDLEEKLYPDAGTSLTFEIHDHHVNARYFHNTQVLTHRWDLSKRYIGIRFRPGGATALLSDAVNEVQNADIDLLDLALPQRDHLQRLMDHLPTLTSVQQIGAVEHWLAGLIPEAHQPAYPLSAVLTESSKTLLPPQQLADRIGLTRRTLERHFRRHLGFTPNQVHNFAQIKQARRQLITSAAGLSEIALDCGYFDQAHFTNVFRQHTFETPRQYRLRKLSQISNE